MMDIEVTNEDLKDKNSYFEKATYAFFRQLGLDSILVRGKEFQDENDWADLLLATHSIVLNLDQAQEEMLDLKDGEIDEYDSEKNGGEGEA